MDTSGGSGSNSLVRPIVDENGTMDMNGTMDNLEERISNLEMVLLTISPSTYALLLDRFDNNVSFKEEVVHQRLRKTLTHVLELSSCIYLDDRAWGVLNFDSAGERYHPQKKGNSKGESSNSGSVVVVQDGFDDGDFGDVMMVCSVSTADTWIMDTNSSHRMTKFNCWFVPGLKKNLISLGTLAKNGLKYHGEGDSVIGTTTVSQSSDKRDDRKNLWHRRLGHISEQGLSVLSKQGLLGGDGGCVYFVTFIDDYSREVWVYFLKTKYEVFGKFKEWKTMVEKQTGKQVKTLRTDNGLEFCNTLFDNFCKKEGVCAYLLVYRNNFRLKKLTLQAIWLIDLHQLQSVLKRLKRNDPAVKCIFLEYATGVKGYRLWCKEGKTLDKFLISRYVTFDKSAMLGQSRGCKSFVGTKDCGADQKVEFDTPNRVVIEDEQ
nr:retrovirus-related Pol polyprotein from transposon TNT 1-94 [Tanacetum cinerariifolium]